MVNHGMDRKWSLWYSQTLQFLELQGSKNSVCQHLLTHAAVVQLLALDSVSMHIYSQRDLWNFWCLLFLISKHLNWFFAFPNSDDSKATLFDHLGGTIFLSIVMLTCCKITDDTNNPRKSTLTEVTFFSAGKKEQLWNKEKIEFLWH